MVIVSYVPSNMFNYKTLLGLFAASQFLLSVRIVGSYFSAYLVGSITCGITEILENKVII